VAAASVAPAAAACDAQRPQAPPTTSAPAEVQPAETEVKHVIKHICPDCGKSCDSLEETREHWLKEHHKPAQSPLHDGDGNSDEGDNVKAQLLETDDKGQPVIVRQTDKETGNSWTVVLNEDGTKRTFSEEDVEHMLSQSHSELENWFGEMPDRQFRGLSNELTHRLCERSNKLFKRRQQFEEESRRCNFAVFGLGEGADVKELDNAYRKLARAMHPDKNGGSDEAKHRFQAMKEKYEELREAIITGTGQQGQAEKTSDGKASAEEGPSPSDGSNAGKDKETQEGSADEAEAGEKEGNEEDGSQPDNPKGSGKHAGGDSDRASNGEEGTKTQAQKDKEKRKELEAKVWKMLNQLKMIGQNLQIVEANFGRLKPHES